MRKRSVAIISLAFVTCPLPAMASGSDSASITVTGTIERSCSIAMAASSLDLGDVVAAGTISANVAFNCNTPFVVHLMSDGGALVHNGAREVAGFETIIPYTASLNLPFDDGGVGAINACASAALLAGASCGSLNSATHTAIRQTAALSLQWLAQAATPRLAGRYQDVIRISVEFAP